MHKFDGMLSEIIKMATRQGVHFGTVQVIDSVHTTANVNTQKNRKRHKVGKRPRDPDAKWDVRQVKNEKEVDIKKIESFLG